MEVLPLAKGLATWVPFLYSARRGSTGGTGDARYCYSVWLRHLVALHNAGICRRFASVAELGPGDSLGIGLAAMLCGAERLLALDVVRYATNRRNADVLDGLVKLFEARAAIPGDDEFPGVFPQLADYGFPAFLVDQVTGDSSCAVQRRQRIEAALEGRSSTVAITYRVPWDIPDERDVEPVDLLYSQAVLEHVEDPSLAYSAMARWVAPGGAMSHVIDLRSHRLTEGWDGHLQYRSAVWRLVKGARPYLLNRRSATQHRQWLQASGFQVVEESRVYCSPTVDVKDLAPEFREWSEEDRSTATVHFLAVRK